MIKIKLTKTTKEGNAGDIIEVTANIAHGIIDRGEGKLNSFQSQEMNFNNRMLSNKRIKNVIK